MEKVLIITYLPWATPRIPGLARYLPEFGWEPVILTPRLRAKPCTWLRVVETPYRDSLGFLMRLFRLNPEVDDIHREVRAKLGLKYAGCLVDFALTRAGEIINYPDSLKGWLSQGIEAGSRLLREGNFAAMISSSSPVTAHLIARALKHDYRIPWIADLRDLWSQNHNYTYSRLRRYFERRLEVRTLSRAAALVTVSRPWADRLKSLHHNEATYVITNGFDPAEVSSTPSELTAKFTLTYTGTVYRRRQHPGRLFAALRELVAGGALRPDDVEVRFYGARAPWLEEEVRRYGLSGIVKQYGLISRQAARERQKESQLLLLFDWDDPGEKGIYPGKVFEYLAARRPILAIGGVEGNVVHQLLEEAGAGVTAPTVEETSAALGELYREYRQGGVIYKGDASGIDRYSYRQIAGNFAGILDGLTRPRVP